MRTMLRVLIALLITAPCIASAQLRMGVALEAGSSDPILLSAAQRVDFVLNARDELGASVENWNDIGYDAMLVVSNSYAESDSSRNSWNAWPDGYTWLRLEVNGAPLTADSISSTGEVRSFFTIPKSAFVLGRATLTFIQSRADSNIILTVTPLADFLPQQSPPINVRPGGHADYLLDITSPFVDSDDVYLLRKYEVLVAPRDRYTNVISGQEILTNFTARYRTEFDSNYPHVSDPFSAPMKLDGITSFFLMSRVRREDVKSEKRQWLQAFSTLDSTVRGTTSPYQIHDHAPNPYNLLSPVDQVVIKLERARDKVTFSWQKASPPDPYVDIQISRFDPLRVSDLVLYDVQFVDALTLTRVVAFERTDYREDTTLTLNHAELSAIIDQISGQRTTRELNLVWYAIARDFDNTDGLMLGPLYATISNPPPNNPMNLPGFRLKLTRQGPIEPVGITQAISHGFVLHQNYPNPFNPSTTIALQLPNPGHCRLLVHNLLGEEVAVLHDGFLDAGEHTFSFDGGGLPSGTYSYQLITEAGTLTRSMLLLR